MHNLRYSVNSYKSEVFRTAVMTHLHQTVSLKKSRWLCLIVTIFRTSFLQSYLQLLFCEIWKLNLKAVCFYYNYSSVLINHYFVFFAGINKNE